MITDRGVIERLTKANELIKKAVALDEQTRPAISTPEDDPLGPALSLAFRAGPDVANPTRTSDPTVYAAAEGFAYGVDGLNGNPLWQTAIGSDVPFPPVAIPGSPPALLVFDSRRDELLKLNGRDGSFIWRQPLGEAVLSAPLVLGNQIFQVLPSGSLLVIDLSNGSVLATLNLGRPLAQTPVADEAGQYLYVVANESVVFVLCVIHSLVYLLIMSATPRVPYPAPRKAWKVSDRRREP